MLRLHSCTIKFVTVFAIFAVIPVPQEFSLSGRNWSFGFPLGYFDFRQNLPGLNYGGVRNFYIVGFLVDAVIAVVSVNLLKIFCTRYLATREKAAFWLLTGCLIATGYAAQGSAFKAFDALYFANRHLAWTSLAILTIGTIFCVFILIWLAIKERSVRSQT